MGQCLLDNRARSLAEKLRSEGKLEIHELRSGLSIQATAFVGRVDLGSLVVTILPKLPGAPLLTLLRYAYGLRSLKLFETTSFATCAAGFQDILIWQLAAEIEDLLRHGLYRSYRRVEQELSSPRGRIDFSRMARRIGFAASLPCVHHPRLEDCLHNRIVLAGLRMASAQAGDRELKSRVRQLARMIEGNVSTVHLHRPLFDSYEQTRSRITASYDPAIRLIQLLWRSAGVSLDDNRTVALPGFLFNMNRFFQALIGRFLTDNLPGYRVESEYRLREMMAYVPGFNPQRRTSPKPRPDFAVLRDSQVLQFLDAKYRDIWSKGLPPDMLYQLAIYAFAQPRGHTSVLLYPAVGGNAREARVEIREPVHGLGVATVIQRPVNLLRLEELVRPEMANTLARSRRAFAHELAFGQPSAAISGV